VERYVIIHGHFYQPPRENPWLEHVEIQDSASPCHDWNERITAECYAPNGASRILDEQGRINEIVNNYSRISFNVGPTLMAWLEAKDPETYHRVRQADAESQARYGGYGSALAQAYNHMIMPLANAQDKRTQIIWGIKDFIHRFGREPHGMWLPETAVDIASLEAMAALGIRFTLMAPHQAARIRSLRGGPWQDVSGGRIDPTTPYQIRLPSGKTMAIFFYDNLISRAVAFEDLLQSGEGFARRLTTAFRQERPWPQVVHIATDGETYGHHRRHGDMALAYALHEIEKEGLARLTNYEEYLSKHPPTFEVQIVENTSWSCSHGVERWRSDCGCHADPRPGWRQAWRAPLREALDWLRDTLAPKFEEMASRYLKDPWKARDEYINVILDRSRENVDGFLAGHSANGLDRQSKTQVIKLLEMQRHAMLMYTSCGWFFDDISGIEAIQVLQYAGRALQLAEDLLQQPLEAQFLSLLQKAPSNVPSYVNGRQVFERFVKPAEVDLVKVGAHYAVDSLFEAHQDRDRIYCYTVERKEAQSWAMGDGRLVVGKARVSSDITSESATLTFGSVYLGGHTVNAGVRPFNGNNGFNDMAEELSSAFQSADFAGVIRLLDKHFGGSSYSLGSLFREQQRKIMEWLTQDLLSEAEDQYHSLYRRHQPLLRFLVELNMPIPKILQDVAELVVNTRLTRLVDMDPPDWRMVWRLLDESRDLDLLLDSEGLGFHYQAALERVAERWRRSPADLEALSELADAVSQYRALPFAVNLWRIQNLVYEVLQAMYHEFQQRSRMTDGEASQWLDLFARLSQDLQIRVD
jgi:alpha-amylase/alpha-mannosidase (GH57 family)